MKKGLHLTLAFLVITALLLLGIRWAERDDRLNLLFARIDNSGLVDSVDIAEALKPYFGTSMLKLDTESLELRLLAIEGVDSVSVTICYPETLIISFETRKPAAILAYGTDLIPVTVSGDHLPVDWYSDTLPVVAIEGYPDHEVISSALRLLIKRQVSHSVSFEVSSSGITIEDNGVQVILNPGKAAENWVQWQTIKTMITDQTDEVDLRFANQAVLRSAEET